MRSLLLVAIALSSTLPVAAQGVTADVAVNSQYQWRGLTTTNRPVVQPSVVLAAPFGPFTVAAGTWGNIEAGRYDDAQSHISQGGGSGVALTEYDAWVEVSRVIGWGTVTTGVLAYRFPNDLGVTATANTTELYAKASAAAPLAPTLTIWQDIRKVSGAYAEASIGQAVSRARFSVTTGWNLGQTFDGGSTAGYFARRGFTHADIAASTTWVSGSGLALTSSVHVVVAGDPGTRVTAPGRTGDAKVWIGSSISWARAIRSAAIEK